MPDHPYDGQPLDDHPDLLPPEDPEQVRRARVEAASELHAQERQDRQAEDDLAWAERLEIDAEVAEVRQLYSKGMADRLCADLGLDPNEANAAACHRLAADDGDGTPQRRVADSYRDGSGIRQCPVEAAYWYARAAGQGDAYAMLQLAIAHEFGRGVPQDLAEAQVWRRRVQNGVP